MLRVRRAAASDADPVFALTREFSTSFEPEADAFNRAFVRLIEGEEVLLLLAETDGVVSGYLLGFMHDTLFANGPVAWVEEVMVDERFRRVGIGRELMGEFEVWARLRGAKLIGLATRRASDFYLTLGYEQSAAYSRKLLEPPIG